MKTLTIAAALALTASTVFARDNIQIAGSSTVLPYASIVAEAFGENFDFPTPVVESGGSGAGRKRLCEGIGETTIDIANSSSLMKEAEATECKKVIGDFTEVRIGYDGIVFATSHSNKGFNNLTPEQIFLALNAKSNYSHWSDIDPSLPDTEILVFVPGTKHGTREVFDVKVMQAGCKAAGMYEELGKKGCHQLRVDGRSIDIDGDYTETLARIDANTNGIGVFGLSFLLNNTDKIYAADIKGVKASVTSIASGEYPVSRPLQFYVKNAHLNVIPGLREYIQFFVSDDMAGPDGPLATYGLVPDPELATTQKMVSEF